MSPYNISYLGPDSEVVAEEVQWFEHDDHATDAIGNSDHPYEIHVRQSERLVARFPPWPKRLP